MTAIIAEKFFLNSFSWIIGDKMYKALQILLIALVSVIVLLPTSQVKVFGVENRPMERYQWNNSFISEASPEDSRLTLIMPVSKILLIK